MKIFTASIFFSTHCWRSLYHEVFLGEPPVSFFSWIPSESIFICRDELRSCGPNSIPVQKSEPPWLPYMLPPDD